ncbi:DUF6465 family protein [Eubacterium sp.]|uniref:DUF6465 family protein n=1 Tax=Eubacterium sp. TaxID=142586 RepID=UPI002FCA5A23
MAQVRNKKSAAAGAMAKNSTGTASTAAPQKKDMAPAAKAPAAPKSATATTKATTTPTSKKTSTKKKTVTEVVVQFDGKEFKSADLITRVKEIWTKEMGRKVNEAADMTVYVNTDEGMAYYVINGGDVTGSFAL